MPPFTLHRIQVAACALDHVAVLLYDWKNFTLQQLLGAVKRPLGGRPLLSLAVIAPSSKPGVVGAQLAIIWQARS